MRLRVLLRRENILVPLAVLVLAAALAAAAAPAPEPPMDDAALIRQVVARALDKKPEDLTPQDLASVERLDLTPYDVTDLRPLRKLTGLKALDMANTRVADLSSLSWLLGLEVLNLESTPVSNLKPLAYLANLRRLDLRDTFVADLAPLAHLAALRELRLEGSRVTDLTPLAGLANLKVTGPAVAGAPAAGGMFAAPEPSESLAKVAYVIDGGDAMTALLPAVKTELKHSLGGLTASVEFLVVFSRSAATIALPEAAMLSATGRQKYVAAQFIDSFSPAGQMDAPAALARALAAKPNLIYFATCGPVPPAVLDVARRSNAARQVTIHTLLLVNRSPESEKVLKLLADENKGDYKFISPAEFEAVTQ